MAKSAAEAIGPDAKLDPVFARALREALFWLLAALALVLFIALASFDPADRSFSYTGEPGQVSNLIGPLGAWLRERALPAVRLAGVPVSRRDRVQRLGRPQARAGRAGRRAAPRSRCA